MPINPLQHLEDKVADTAAEANRLREQISDLEPTDPRRNNLVAQKNDAADQNSRLAAVYDRAWAAQVAADAGSIRVEKSGNVTLVQGDGFGGGKSQTFAAGSPEAKRLLAERDHRRTVDVAVATAAFAHYGCHPQQCRLDYYGDQARVSIPGKRPVTVRYDAKTGTATVV